MASEVRRFFNTPVRVLGLAMWLTAVGVDGLWDSWWSTYAAGVLVGMSCILVWWWPVPETRSPGGR